MKKQAIRRLRQAALELRRYLKTGRYRTLPPDRAFIQWYVLARFGSPQTWQMLDGKKDGGLDAIVKTDDTIFVLQSKYEPSAKVSQVTRSEVATFENVARKFGDPDLRDEFTEWRDTVRPQLHGVYDSVRRAATGKAHVRFMFVTSKRSNYNSDGLYEVEDIQNVAALWYLHSEGFTPPTEHIDLTLDSSWHTSDRRGQYRTYVGLADVRDFLNLMSRDVTERLFAQMSERIFDRRSTRISAGHTSRNRSCFGLGTTVSTSFAAGFQLPETRTDSRFHRWSTALRRCMLSPNRSEGTHVRSSSGSLRWTSSAIPRF